jgi:transketolase
LAIHESRRADGVRKLDAATITAARKRLLQMHFEANVGHIGGNLSSIDAMLVVFHEYLSESDTFILSKGHSVGALYATLWSKGALGDDDLVQFHQDDTLLAAHPPARGIPHIKFATGSLGHGFSLAAGTALGLKLRSQAGRVFCLTSDGEWQEGSTWEALIFSTHHALSNLTVLVDHNGLQGFGSTAEVASMSPLWKRLSGFDADVSVIDGHDIEAIRAALSATSDTVRIVILKTVKGHGVSFMADRMEWHYLPLSAEQYAQALAEIELA